MLCNIDHNLLNSQPFLEVVLGTRIKNQEQKEKKKQKEKQPKNKSYLFPVRLNFYISISV